MTDHLLLDEKWNICDGEGNIRGGRLDSVIDNGRIDLFPMGAVGRRLIAVGHLCSVHHLSQSSSDRSSSLDRSVLMAHSAFLYARKMQNRSPVRSKYPPPRHACR